MAQPQPQYCAPTDTALHQQPPSGNRQKRINGNQSDTATDINHSGSGNQGDTETETAATPTKAIRQSASGITAKALHQQPRYNRKIANRDTEAAAIQPQTDTPTTAILRQSRNNRNRNTEAANANRSAKTDTPPQNITPALL